MPSSGPQTVQRSSQESSNQLPNYFDFACSVDRVSEFIKAVCRSIFTIKDVWGSRRNFTTFMSSIDRYLRLGHKETLTVMQVCVCVCVCACVRVCVCKCSETLQQKLTQNEWNLPSDHLLSQICKKMRTQEMSWIRQLTLLPHPITLSASDILHQFIYWLFTTVVNQLVAVCFYVTEAEGRGMELLYYRKPVWARLMKKGEKQLDESFVRVPEAAEHMSDKHTISNADTQLGPINLDEDFIPKQPDSFEIADSWTGAGTEEAKDTYVTLKKQSSYSSVYVFSALYPPLFILWLVIPTQQLPVHLWSIGDHQYSRLLPSFGSCQKSTVFVQLQT